jgi:hypothetical protein
MMGFASPLLAIAQIDIAKIFISEPCVASVIKQHSRHPIEFEIYIIIYQWHVWQGC